MTENQKRLGRGLDALFRQTRPGPVRGSLETEALASPTGTLQLKIAEITANPFQPRRDFDPVQLGELENSLRESGLIQPITVRPLTPHAYQLVAGERRLRAATRLGWTTIPAVVRVLDDRDMLVLSLVENLQRADLHPLDEAHGYRRLISEFQLSHTQIAAAVGKDRSTITNLLRVLSLPEGIQTLLKENRITLGHARSLLGLPNERAMIDIARKIVEHDLSVRDVERLASIQKPSHPSRKATAASIKAPALQPPAEVRRLTELLRKRLQTDVQVHLSSEAKGELSLAFYSPEDLRRLAELILGRSPDVA